MEEQISEGMAREIGPDRHRDQGRKRSISTERRFHRGTVDVSSGTRSVGEVAPHRHVERFNPGDDDRASVLSTPVRPVVARVSSMAGSGPKSRAVERKPAASHRHDRLRRFPSGGFGNCKGKRHAWFVRGLRSSSEQDGSADVLTAICKGSGRARPKGRCPTGSWDPREGGGFDQSFLGVSLFLDLCRTLPAKWALSCTPESAR